MYLIKFPFSPNYDSNNVYRKRAFKSFYVLVNSLQVVVNVVLLLYMIIYQTTKENL